MAARITSHPLDIVPVAVLHSDPNFVRAFNPFLVRLARQQLVRSDHRHCCKSIGLVMYKPVCGQKPENRPRYQFITDSHLKKVNADLCVLATYPP